jgi:peptide/nickel transport system substrate-binding protein
MDRRSRRQVLVQLAALAVGGLGLEACLRGPAAPTAPTSAPVSLNAPTAAALSNAPTSAPAAAAAATSAPTSAPTAQPANQPKRGGTVTVGVQGDWVTLDPPNNNADLNVILMIYDPLLFFRPDASGTWSYHPGLAERWDFNDKTGTLFLRQGVKFHDGTDFNADVVAWNIQRIVADPKSLARDSLFGLNFDDPVKVVDPYTLQLNLTHPAPGLLQQLSDYGDFFHLFPVSQTAFEKAGADAYARAPVGTGPMKFVEWRASDRIILQRNENYWMKAPDGQPLPYLDGITYRLIIDDSVRAVELKSHNIDHMTSIAVSDVPSIKADPTLTFIDVDWVVTTWRMYFNARGGPFADNLALRQAALYAIDRETMAQTLAPGVSSGAYYIFQPGQFGYDNTLPKYTYDLDKAKSLMAQAGYSDGIDVNLLIINRELDQRQAQIIQQMWSQVGIRVTIDAMERAALNAKVLTGNGDYHVTVGLALANPSDPDSATRPYLTSTGNFNKSHMNVPDLDAAVAKAASSYDPAVRQPAYAEVQKLNFDNAYLGFLWTQRNNYGLTKRVEGFPPPPTQMADFRTVWVSS